MDPLAHVTTSDVLFSPVNIGSFIIRLVCLLIALLAALAFSAWLDRRGGGKFRDLMAIIRSDAKSAGQYAGLRWIGICILVAQAFGALLFLAVVTTTPVKAASIFPDRYDGEIRAAVKLWWGDYPHWQAWKAQLYQESLLNPEAVSPAGAMGLAQFMPATWREITRAMGWGTVDRRLAQPAIEGGAFYMARLRVAWPSPRPPDERQRLAQASYNAGIGNILKAQRLCGNARLWAAISPCLDRVTGKRNAAETTGYVDRIAKWQALIAAGL